MEIERAQPPRVPGDCESVADADTSGQTPHEKHHRNDEYDDRKAHRFHVGPGDRLNTAKNRVNDCGTTDSEGRQRHIPPEDDRQDHSWRRDDRTDRHAARQQKEETREGSGLEVEASLQVFLRRVYLRSIEKWD